MATKVKTLKNSQASRFKSPKRFNPAQLAAMVAVFVVVGAVLIKLTFAASTTHNYYYNSTGIGHTIGHASAPMDFVYNSQVFYGKTLWQWDGGNPNSVHMWWGPKVTITPPHSSVHVCWYYVPPPVNAATVVYDVYYDGYTTSHILSYEKDGVPAASSIPFWSLHVHCVNVPVQAGHTYVKFEIGLRPVSGDRFFLYKTTWAYN